MLLAALAYARRGWAVFQLMPGSKRPFPDSNGLRDATTDEETVRRWWTEMPRANIGITTGIVSDLAVLDFDECDARTWCEEHDVRPRAVVRTPSGGWHFYYRMGGAVFPNSASRLRPGLDTRGTGGYVVAPPSVIDAGSYSWARQEGLDTIPSWIPPLLAPTPPVTTPPRATPIGDVIERARRYISKMSPAVSGQGGHDAAFRVALVLVKGFALDENTATVLFCEYSQRCLPPWSDREIAHKIKQARQSRAEEGYLLGKR